MSGGCRRGAGTGSPVCKAPDNRLEAPLLPRCTVAHLWCPVIGGTCAWDICGAEKAGVGPGSLTGGCLLLPRTWGALRTQSCRRQVPGAHPVCIPTATTAGRWGVRICVHVRVYLCACMYAHMHMCTHAGACAYTHVHVCTHSCTYIICSACVCVYECVYMPMCTCMCIYRCMCMLGQKRRGTCVHSCEKEKTWGVPLVGKRRCIQTGQEKKKYSLYCGSLPVVR